MDQKKKKKEKEILMLCSYYSVILFTKYHNSHTYLNTKLEFSHFFQLYDIKNNRFSFTNQTEDKTFAS